MSEVTDNLVRRLEQELAQVRAERDQYERDRQETVELWNRANDDCAKVRAQLDTAVKALEKIEQQSSDRPDFEYGVGKIARDALRRIKGGSP